MATKVTLNQILSLNPSQLNAEGAIPGDSLVATPSNGGLTLTWSPTSILPRTGLHGQVLTYNYYTSKWMASSINVGGGGSTLPLGTSGDVNKVLTWNGAQWIIASPQGTVTSVGITNTDGTLTVSTPNVITSTGVITIGLNTVSLPKINQGGAAANQVLTWNGSTNSWAPSAVSNSVGTMRAYVLFDGRAEPISSGILAQRNVTSITDHGVGDYTINFAAGTFGSSNYVYSYGIGKGASGNYTSSVVEVSGSRSASSIRINTGFVFTASAFTNFDASNISLLFVS